MSWNDKFDTLKNQVRGLNGANAEAAKAFQGVGKAVKEGGVVDFKTKEFVALGIAVATKCEPCIMFHIDALIRQVPPATKSPTCWECVSRWAVDRGG